METFNLFYRETDPLPAGARAGSKVRTATGEAWS
jgi:hypothetical protein